MPKAVPSAKVRAISPLGVRLRPSVPAILPSLLLCDFADLGAEIRRVEQAGVPALHLDVMDGHFVPNLTYGMTIVEAARRVSDLPLDCHLMISNPADYIGAFADAGADSITIHFEAVTDPSEILRAIRESGLAAGLAINPPTPWEAVLPHLAQCDLILVMSVMPGFGGQAFDPTALTKLTAIRQAAPDNVLLEVDGGINNETIGPCAEAGAELFVVGSAIFGRPDYTASVAELRSRANPPGAAK